MQMRVTLGLLMPLTGFAVGGALGAQTAVAPSSEITVEGAVLQGGLGDLLSADGVREILVESETGGKPSRRTSRLEHAWIFSEVPPALDVSLLLSASRNANGEGDDFEIRWSVGDGAAVSDVVHTVANPSLPNEPLRVALSGAEAGGEIRILISDSNAAPGSRTLDTVEVDFLALEVVPDPSGGGGGPSAFDPAFACLDGGGHVGRLLVVNTFGTELRELTRVNVYPPCWSPDGERLAFTMRVNQRGVNPGIYTVAWDGSDLRQVRSAGNEVLHRIDWSPTPAPDGNVKLAYRYSDQIWNGIRVANPDGGGDQALVSGDVIDPAWSPDSRRLAVRTLDKPEADVKVLYLEASPAGGIAVAGIRDVLVGGPLDVAGATIASVSWWPPGDFLLITVLDYYWLRYDGLDLSGIWSIDLSTLEQQRLTAAVNAADPDASDDGTRILFTRRGELWLLDSSGERRLPTSVGVGHPVWRPGS